MGLNIENGMKLTITKIIIHSLLLCYTLGYLSYILSITNYKYINSKNETTD